MFLNISITEWVGYLASLALIISFMMKNLNTLKPIYLSDDLNNDHSAYLPSQSTLATGEYPLIATVRQCFNEPKQGSIYLYTAFVLSDKGQRILLKQCYMPIN